MYLPQEIKFARDNAEPHASCHAKDDFTL